MNGRISHREPLLVGRQQELALIRRLLEESASGGRLQIVFVAGEPGIGKTRLLNEAAQHAGQRDIPVLRGGASEAEGMPPYLPFLEALGQYIRAAEPDQLREQITDMASVLATILPELSSRLGQLPTSYRLPPEQARVRLYEAIGTFLSIIASTYGLLLLLDDVQWADTATLDLLCHVARHQPDARLLVLGAYREGEITHRSSFERMLTKLTRLRRLSIITPGPLSGSELTELAADCLSGPVDPLLSHLLAVQSEGNPFFAEELLHGWLESGAIAYQESRFCLISPVDAALPSSILGTIRQRLSRLSAPVIALLRIAAVFGRTFETAKLSGIAGQEIEVIEDHLQEAVQARLICASGPGIFIFSHDTIRECLYGEVSSARRARLHTLIGRLLEQQLNQTDNTENVDARQLAELAFHFARSGERASGAIYSQRAAEQAKRAYAPAEAMRHYRTALTLLDKGDSRCGSWLLGLGETALLAGFFQDAIDAFRMALDWFVQHTDSTVAGQAALGLGRAHWRLEAIGPARSALEQAIALLPSGPDADTVQALIELGSLLLLSLHDQAGAALHLERAYDLARQSCDAHLEAAASRALGNLLMRSGNLAEGIPLLERALAQAVALDDPLEAAECCACLTMAYNWSGQIDGWEELLQRGLLFAQRSHDLYQMRHIYSHLATIHAFRGQWAEVEADLAQSQKIVEQLSSPEPLLMLQWTRGMLTSLRGDIAAAEDMLSRAIAGFRALSPQSLVWWLGGLGFIQVIQGKRQEALACLDELETVISSLPAGAMPAGHTLTFMAAIAAVLGERTWATRLYSRLLPFRGQRHSFLVDRILGSLALLLGDFQAAHEHLAEAETLARRFAFPSELAFTLEARADLALAQDKRNGAIFARRWLEEALKLFEQLDIPVQVHRLHERLRRLVRRGARLHLPARLSRREAEVLRLVALGRSNREIAAALAISERTVANHLASIFNKTGADNRAAATAFAIRHGLAE